MGYAQNPRVNDDDYRRAYEEARHVFSTEIRRLQEKVTLWRAAAIIILLLSLVAIAELRGCLPRGGNYPEYGLKARFSSDTTN